MEEVEAMNMKTNEKDIPTNIQPNPEAKGFAWNAQERNIRLNIFVGFDMHLNHN